MAWKLQLNTAEPGKPDDWQDVKVGPAILSYAREGDALRMLNGLSDDHGGRCRHVEYESDDERKRRLARAEKAKADAAKKAKADAAKKASSSSKRKTGARRRA